MRATMPNPGRTCGPVSGGPNSSTPPPPSSAGTGLGSLTVAGVAAEAGVSRQWVYEHFSDLDDLYRALILDRFAALDADIDAAKVTMSRDRVGRRSRPEQVFALVPADRRILRALVDGAGWNRPELAGIESELRERILETVDRFRPATPDMTISRRAPSCGPS